MGVQLQLSGAPMWVFLPSFPSAAALLAGLRAALAALLGWSSTDGILIAAVRDGNGGLVRFDDLPWGESATGAHAEVRRLVMGGDGGGVAAPTANPPSKAAAARRDAIAAQFFYDLDDELGAMEADGLSDSAGKQAGGASTKPVLQFDSLTASERKALKNVGAFGRRWGGRWRNKRKQRQQRAGKLRAVGAQAVPPKKKVAAGSADGDLHSHAAAPTRAAGAVVAPRQLQASPSGSRTPSPSVSPSGSFGASHTPSVTPTATSTPPSLELQFGLLFTDPTGQLSSSDIADLLMRRFADNAALLSAFAAWLVSVEAAAGLTPGSLRPPRMAALLAGVSRPVAAPEQPNLSTAAVTGIAVGAALVGLILLTVVVLAVLTLTRVGRESSLGVGVARVQDRFFERDRDGEKAARSRAKRPKVDWNGGAGGGLARLTALLSSRGAAAPRAPRDEGGFTGGDAESGELRVQNRLSLAARAAAAGGGAVGGPEPGLSPQKPATRKGQKKRGADDVGTSNATNPLAVKGKADGGSYGLDAYRGASLGGMIAGSSSSAATAGVEDEEAARQRRKERRVRRKAAEQAAAAEAATAGADAGDGWEVPGAGGSGDTGGAGAAQQEEAHAEGELPRRRGVDDGFATVSQFHAGDDDAVAGAGVVRSVPGLADTKVVRSLTTYRSSGAAALAGGSRPRSARSSGGGGAKLHSSPSQRSVTGDGGGFDGEQPSPTLARASAAPQPISGSVETAAAANPLRAKSGKKKVRKQEGEGGEAMIV